MSIEKAQVLKQHIDRQLSAVEVPSASDEKALRGAVAPFVDKLTRLDPTGNLESVAHHSVQYIKTVHEALQLDNADDRNDWMEGAKEKLEAQLSKAHGVKDSSSLALDTVEAGMAKLGIYPQLGKKPVDETKAKALSDVATTDATEITGIMKASSVFEPLKDKLKELGAQEQSDLFTDLFNAFMDIGGEKGEVKQDELKAVKETLNKMLTSEDGLDPQKLKAFLGTLSSGTKQALGEYVNGTMLDGLTGGNSFKVALGLEEGMKGYAKNSLAKLAIKLPARQSYADLDFEEQAKKRKLIAESIVILGKEAQGEIAEAKKMNPNYDAQAHMDEKIQTLQDKIEKQFGADVKLYKDEVQVIANHLKLTENSSKEDQVFDMQNFIKDYGQYAIMAVPFLLGPLASVVSMVPLVGQSVAGLAPWLNGVAEKVGMPIMLLMANKMSNGSGKSEPEAASEAKKAVA